MSYVVPSDRALEELWHSLGGAPELAETLTVIGVANRAAYAQGGPQRVDDAKAAAWQEMTERVTARAVTSSGGIALPAQVLAVVACTTG